MVFFRYFFCYVASGICLFQALTNVALPTCFLGLDIKQKKELQKVLKDGNCLQFIGYQQLYSRQAKSIMLGSVCFLMRSSEKALF